ncbi:MAG: D-alanine--D-alanine ligase [Candidatus Cloacimonadota bacterium]|nr:D-alanine--D-alanine ligase [Candidatus Cloacimonadota bacterium]
MDKIVLLKGGISEEREVSLHTCSAVENAFKRLGKNFEIVDPYNFLENGKVNYNSLIKKLQKIAPTIVFNGLHGGDGENGNIQGILTAHNISFTGSGKKACSIAMDKIQSKLLAKNLGIPVPDFLKYEKGDKISEDKIINSLGLPIVIKPNSSGSSVGISIVTNREEIFPAIEKAAEFDACVLIEKFIPNREITVAILGQSALPVVEIIADNGWYDYIHKYTKGKTVYESPANIDAEQSLTVQKYAEMMFKKMDCADYARVDFRFDGKKFYFLELNTLPGMTNLSLVPMAAKAINVGFDDLIRKISEKDFKME